MTIDPFGNSNSGDTGPQGPQGLPGDVGPRGPEGPKGPPAKGNSLKLINYQGFGPLLKFKYQFTDYWNFTKDNNAQIAPTYADTIKLKKAYINISTDPFNNALKTALKLDLVIDGLAQDQHLLVNGPNNKQLSHVFVNEPIIRAGQVFNIRTAWDTNPNDYSTVRATHVSFEYEIIGSSNEWTIEPNGGLQLNQNNQLALAPMKLLWSGEASQGTYSLLDSPEKYRMIHCTSNYEQGRIITSNFCPAAAGIQNPNWYVDVGTTQVLKFHGSKHKNITITDSGQLDFGLNSIYGQL